MANRIHFEDNQSFTNDSTKEVSNIFNNVFTFFSFRFTKKKFHFCLKNKPNYLLKTSQ